MTAATRYLHLRTPLSSHNGRQLHSPQLQDKTNPQKPILNQNFYFQPITRADAFEENQPSSDDQQDIVESRIFRPQIEESLLDSMWTLKRANPIMDEDEEEVEQYFACESPTKRTRTRTLDDADRIDDDKPFVLKFQE